MAEPQVAPLPRRLSVPLAVGRLGALEWTALGVTGAMFAVYGMTALRGVSFGDWAEMQQVPARLEIPHTTGYPLYVLLGKLFSLIPVGSVAFRANLLSGAAAAAAVGMTVLIAGRLGVRPMVGLAAAVALGATATLWTEATFAEMNTLHLFLSALVVHRALVWRDTRADRDLRLGALFCGLALSNHLLALSVVPIVGAFVLAADGLSIVRRPRLLLQLALLFAAGLAFYLFIVLRAFSGPAVLYEELRSFDGFFAFVSGAQFRVDMRFGSGESVEAALAAAPEVWGAIHGAGTVAFSFVALVGAPVLVARDRWAGLLLATLVAGNLYMYAGYRGDLEHYLLLTWLVLAVWLAVVVEELVRRAHALLGHRGELVPVAALALAVALLAWNWPARDQSANRVGERFTAEVFAALPPDAVLISYWDTLTTLGYAHCIEGARPDLTLVSYNPAFTGTCDLLSEPIEAAARDRPVYALFVFDQDLDRLRGAFELVPVTTIELPYGKRFPEIERPLYRLESKRAVTGRESGRGHRG